MVFGARMYFFEINFKHLDHAGLNKQKTQCTLTA